MGDLVNLRRARKAKARVAAENEAAANRAVFGTPKPARDLTKARSAKARRDLEAGRLDPDKALKY
jgi:hypothetical protein